MLTQNRNFCRRRQSGHVQQPPTSRYLPSTQPMRFSHLGAVGRLSGDSVFKHLSDIGSAVLPAEVRRFRPRTLSTSLPLDCCEDGLRRCYRRIRYNIRTHLPRSASEQQQWQPVRTFDAVPAQAPWLAPASHRSAKDGQHFPGRVQLDRDRKL